MTPSALAIEDRLASACRTPHRERAATDFDTKSTPKRRQNNWRSHAEQVGPKRRETAWLSASVTVRFRSLSHVAQLPKVRDTSRACHERLVRERPERPRRGRITARLSQTCPVTRPQKDLGDRGSV